MYFKEMKSKESTLTKRKSVLKFGCHRGAKIADSTAIYQNGSSYAENYGIFNCKKNI